MRLLVLGGTHHVGRAVVEAALARGDQVTTLNRGVSGPPAAGAQPLHADRTDPAALAAALGDASWDAVIDTWSGAPVAVSQAAALLAGRAGHYGYVSTRSVYQWPMPDGIDESAPVVAGDPADTSSADYAAAKRGGELAAVAAFGDRALLARPGLILGPYEIVGRMPWWLRRLERGGDVLAPGPRDRPLQYIDGRDLAGWLLTAADRGLGGAFNTVSKPGHATMASLLEAAREVTGNRANLVWVPPEVIEAAGSSPGPSYRSGCRRRGSTRACITGMCQRPTPPGCGPAGSRDRRRHLAMAAGRGLPAGASRPAAWPRPGARAAGTGQPGQLNLQLARLSVSVGWTSGCSPCRRRP